MKYILILSFLFFLSACDSKKNKDTNQTLEVNETLGIKPNTTALSPKKEETKKDDFNLIVKEEVEEEVEEVKEEVVEEREVEEVLDENTSIKIEEIENNESIESNESIEHILRKSDEGNISMDKEWYIRIVVEDVSRNLKTQSSQLGHLDNAHGIETFNLKALKPFSGNYVDVVFKNPVGMEAGEYNSDFHLLTTKADSWDFTVKSDENNISMILGFRGVFVLSPYTDTEGRERYTEYRMQTHPLLSQMVLVDVSEDIEIPILSDDEVNEYLFSMNGAKEKDFKLKLQALATSRTTRSMRSVSSSPSQDINTLRIKTLRQDAKSKPKIYKKGNFNDTPPKFELLVK
jgi:hypothetical protein